VPARPRVAVLINPVAGVGATPARARRRAERSADLLSSLGVEPDVFVTQYPGHALELTCSAVARGAGTVVAWGGDGTVNEVASAVLQTSAALGVLPAGSGNGLARMLGMPADAERALPRIVHGTVRLVDVGRIEGALFVNVAGVGFDAHIAAAFAAMGGARRGFLKYAAMVLEELRRYRSAVYDVELDPPAEPIRRRAFVVTFANGRQWGNGAIIAPQAQLDDGRLDAVIVEDRGRLAVLGAIPRLFTGTITRATGVTSRPVLNARVTGRAPLVFHADGEPRVSSGDSVTVSICPGVLRLRS
jgi:diacylglycerol kinase (ATP)